MKPFIICIFIIFIISLIITLVIGNILASAKCELIYRNDECKTMLYIIIISTIILIISIIILIIDYCIITAEEEFDINEEFKSREQDLIDFIYKDNNNIINDIINEKINELEELLEKVNKRLNREQYLIKIEKELIQMKKDELYSKIINNMTEETIKEHLNIYKDDLRVLFNSLNKN